MQSMVNDDLNELKEMCNFLFKSNDIQKDQVIKTNRAF